MSSNAVVLELSEPQEKVWRLLEDPNSEVEEVFFGGCFRAGTLVATKKGHTPIEKVKAGDFVLSLNELGEYLEWKEVLNTFTHNPTTDKKKMITFVGENYSITSTSNHEFYLKGDWKSAAGIARRIMEIRTRHGQQVYCVQHGSDCHVYMEGVKETRNNETRTGRVGLFADNDIHRNQGQNSDNQSSSRGCTSMDSKPKQLPGNKSHQLQSCRQSCMQPGVGDIEQERASQLRCGTDKETDLHQFCKRGEYRNIQIKGGGYTENKKRVQKKGRNTKRLSEYLWRFGGYNQRHSADENMEAYTIDLHGIKDVIIEYTHELVYDLEVEGNSNYCVTDQNIIVHNSAGPGKSFLGCAWQIYRRCRYPNTTGYIGRYSHRTLMDTTFKTFMKVWVTYGRYNPEGVTMKIVGSPKNAVFSNGSEIMFRYTKVDDADAVELGSLEITDIFIDELPENDQSSIELLMTRIRLNLIHDKPAALFAGNPSDNWVMEKYIQDLYETPVTLPPDIAVVPALLDSNPDKKFVEGTKKRLDKIGDDFQKDRLLHGIWGGARKNDEPFFYGYDEKKHKKKADITALWPLWISFDFNLDPTSAVIGQKVNGVGILITTEKQMKGGTEVLCKDIKAAGVMDHPNFIFITGDSSGSKGSTAAGTEPGGRHITDYTIIKNTLEVTDGQIKHNRKVNERLSYSAKVCSRVFTKVPIFIDPGCAVLHKDLRTARRTPDGGLLKNRTSHKQDLGDAFRYLIHVMFPGGIDEVDQFALSIGQHQPNDAPTQVISPPKMHPTSANGSVLDASDYI